MALEIARTAGDFQWAGVCQYDCLTLASGGDDEAYGLVHRTVHFRG
jgi:hypothetical protein